MAERTIGELTKFDRDMITARTAVLALLIETGRINNLTGLDLIEAQKRPEVILEERGAAIAAEQGTGSLDDSPLYRLATQIAKVKPQQ
jgi:hypothetical protein